MTIKKDLDKCAGVRIKEFTMMDVHMGEHDMPYLLSFGKEGDARLQKFEVSNCTVTNESG